MIQGNLIWISSVENSERDIKTLRLHHPCYDRRNEEWNIQARQNLMVDKATYDETEIPTKTRGLGRAGRAWD